ncbi:SDR family oxidoreductase [Sphingomonas sp. URHD0057]|uniref:SDR family oxidoreductase n=1 Tax=Sphingomonas sp. URHD0057 TaxID=1380389 RepID=UPI00048C9223|nr:SDR family oxidoreductase [Sphingomonas sp. URHD0057]
MTTVLITGANRGIGLEFARQYSSDGWSVIATARDPADTDELKALPVRVEQLDMADLDAVADFAAKVDALDLLVANAGTNDPMNADTIAEAKRWARMMVVNSIAPFMLARGLLPNAAATGAKLIAITSGMGSLADTTGGWIPYRASKAALNMAWRSLALEARAQGVTAAMLSPGWVKTRMGGAGAELTPEESVTAMRGLIERLTIGQTGKFLRRDGSEIPW